MKTRYIEYEDRKRLDRAQIKKIQESLESIAPQMIRQYCKGNKEEFKLGAESFIDSKLSYLVSAGIENMRDLTFLDLGCGNTGLMGYDCEGRRMFEPWLCRALVELGAKRVIGIDKADNKKEVFEHYKMDLTDPGCLAIFPPSSIDIATSFSLFDSPDLMAGDRLMSSLKSQLNRIVKPEGLFIHDYLE